MGQVTIDDIVRALAGQGLMAQHNGAVETAKETEDIGLDDIARPEAFARRYSDVVGSISRLRYLLRHRQGNGLVSSGAVIERGRSLYIVRPRFLDWILKGGSA